jgi:hypothetical protein
MPALQSGSAADRDIGRDVRRQTLDLRGTAEPGAEV